MTVRDVVSEINVNGYYIVGYSVCVTLVTAKKHKTPVMCVYARAYRALLFGFLPSLAIARCCASSFSRTSSASSPSSSSSLSSPSSPSSASSSSSPSSPSRNPPPLTSNL